MSDKTHSGKLNIVHFDTHVEITVEDGSSHTRFIEIHVSPEMLMRALTCHGDMPCEFILRPDNVSKIAEHKRVFVRVLRDATKVEKVAALRVLEVDGWIAREEDIFNHHNLSFYDDDSHTYEVMFHRYVDAREEEK